MAVSVKTCPTRQGCFSGESLAYLRFVLSVVVVVVSHIQRIGCQPDKNYFDNTLANPARGLLNRYKQAFLPYIMILRQGRTP